MFHFPAFPPRALYIQARVTPHDWCGVSPFGHPRITVRLPTPRGISQATTSFFGSWCQGIHPVPLQTSTTENKDARVHCAVLKQRPGPPPAPSTRRPDPPTPSKSARSSQPVYRTNGPDHPHHPATRPHPAHSRTRPRPPDDETGLTKPPPEAAVPSGPNSVSRYPPRPDPTPSQPTTPRHHSTTTSRRTKSRTGSKQARHRRSTLEHHPTHIRRRHGPWPPPQPRTPQQGTDTKGR